MNIEPKPPTVKGPAAWFTGDVYIDPVHSRKAEPSRMACGCVHFTPGARTAWHSHAVGQTLLISEGIALLGTRDGKVIVARPGQIVYTPSRRRALARRHPRQLHGPPGPLRGHRRRRRRQLARAPHQRPVQRRCGRDHRNRLEEQPSCGST
jgi:hypothetical protein